MVETRSRSFVKAFSWRISSTVTTVILVYVIIGEFDIAFFIGAVEFVIKTFAYYFHERVWQLISWGNENVD